MRREERREKREARSEKREARSEKREARSEKRTEGQQGDGERVGGIPLLPRVITLILMIQWSSTSFFVPFVSTNNNIRKRDQEGRRGGGR